MIKKERLVKIQISKRKNKKYVATVIDKKTKKTRLIHFGDKRYQQYKDSTPIKKYSNKNHNDTLRRKNYFKRHSGTPLKTKALQIEWKKSKGKFNAKILSHKYLW